MSDPSSTVAERPAPSPRERRVAKTRQAIVAAARALFDQHGYTETTIDQIADRADIAPRTFFRYFPSKEALVFAEFDAAREELWALLEARPRHEDPMHSLVAALAVFADLFEQNYDRLSWGFRLANEHPGLANYEIATVKTATARRMEAFVADRLGVDPERDARPHVWTMMAMALFANAIKITVRNEHGRRHDSVREAFLDLVDDTATVLRSAADAFSTR